MLTIDIGNSRIKWAVFEADEIRQQGVFTYDNNNLEIKLTKARLPCVVGGVQISCVGQTQIKVRFEKWLEANGFAVFRFVETQAKQCGVINSYKSPASMGVDRWLALIAAYNHCGVRKDGVICVIDCGTAITLDFIDGQGWHLGGLIMPGYQTMVDSLTKDAANIQHIMTAGHKEIFKSGLASSTQDAVIKGCSQLVVGGVSSVIERFDKKTDNKVHCVVTGGDGDWVSSELSWANSYHSCLVLQGLNLVSKEKN